MGAYVLRRLALMIPTLVGIMLINFAVIQFAPGGPVEQVIAQLQDGAGATDRFTGGSGDAGGGASAAGAGPSGDYRGAQGLDPEFIAELERQFGFDRPPLERFALMMWNY
ncbi:MAG: microcin ABC transporter permease, partial [Pseudomonadota bacterium]